MFYKKFAAVVLSAILVGAVPCSVLGASDVSSVTDGAVEELSIEDDFSDGVDSISAFASALADKTVSEVQDYQEAKFDDANTALTNTQLFTNRAMSVMMPLMSSWV